MSGLDAREAEAWRRWRSDPTPENAQRWATVRLRCTGQPDNVTLLARLEFPNEAVEQLFRMAVDLYAFPRAWHEATLEDLHWLTECHYWALNVPNAGPGALRAVRRIYEEHCLELKVGDEEEADQDYRDTLSQTQAARQLRRDLAEARRECKEKDEQVSRLKGLVSKLQIKLKHGKSTVEHARLQTEVANLQASYDALKEENERLSRALQAAAKPRIKESSP